MTLKVKPEDIPELTFSDDVKTLGEKSRKLLQGSMYGVMVEEEDIVNSAREALTLATVERGYTDTDEAAKNGQIANAALRAFKQTYFTPEASAVKAAPLPPAMREEFARGLIISGIQEAVIGALEVALGMNRHQAAEITGAMPLTIILDRAGSLDHFAQGVLSTVGIGVPFVEWMNTAHDRRKAALAALEAAAAAVQAETISAEGETAPEATSTGVDGESTPSTVPADTGSKE